MTLLLYSCVQFIFLANAATGALINCGSVHGYVGFDARLSCNTSSPITELSWGVRLLEEPDPLLIVVDPRGERPGTNIASTNYVNRVFFVGNRATGNASIQIKNLTLSDSKDYLWRIDHGGGLGYKRYTMSLTVTVPTTAPPSTNATTKDNQTTTPAPTSSTPAPTTNYTTAAPTTEPKQELSDWVIALIALGAVTVAVVSVYILCGCFCSESLDDCRKSIVKCYNDACPCCPTCPCSCPPCSWCSCCPWCCCPCCPQKGDNQSDDDQEKSPEQSGDVRGKSPVQSGDMREKSPEQGLEMKKQKP